MDTGYVIRLKKRLHKRKGQRFLCYFESIGNFSEAYVFDNLHVACIRCDSRWFEVVQVKRMYSGKWKIVEVLG